ncbi:DNA gyrase C-terminal beta-propeller domain-containing protein, partial [Shewanella frigidimarina]|uniref:DNA gyrase C-terminal beta-propeller domain-containing protein n=1 Tax=Shewanella frigidimarina TaxID=56812 RepID=UPI003F9FEEBA
RANGIIAVNLKDGDQLIGVDITDGNDDIMLFSNEGKVVRFNEKARSSETGEVKIDPETGEEVVALRAMGRTATGVRGIKLEDGQTVVSLIVPKGDGAILTVTENGYGKRTDLSEYPAKSRGTKGVVSIKVSERNGAVVGAVQVGGNDEIMLISNKGTLVRTPAEGVSTIGRNTQGVTIIRTAEDEKVVGLQRIDEIQVPEVELDEEGNPIITEATAETEGQADVSTTDVLDAAAQSDETPTTED